MYLQRAWTETLKVGVELQTELIVVEGSLSTTALHAGHLSQLIILSRTTFALAPSRDSTSSEQPTAVLFLFTS
jgi:hypothetical protein